MGDRQGCRLSGRMPSAIDFLARVQNDLGCSVIQYILAMLGVQQVVCVSKRFHGRVLKHSLIST
jgi:hypothetical protein